MVYFQGQYGACSTVQSWTDPLTQKQYPGFPYVIWSKDLSCPEINVAPTMSWLQGGQLLEDSPPHYFKTWTTNQIKGDNSWSIPPTILRHEQRIRSQGTRIEALLQQVNLNSCLRVDQIHSGMECGTLDTCNLSNKNNSIFHDLFFMNI